MLSLAHIALSAPPPAPFYSLPVHLHPHSHLRLSTGLILLLQCLITTLSCQLLFTTQLRHRHLSITFVGPLCDSETGRTQFITWDHSPPSAVATVSTLVSPVPGDVCTPSTVLGQEMCLLDRDTERW